MPYCDHKRAIFLHISKTGGTTVESLLGIRLLLDSDPLNMPSPQHLTCGMLRARLGDKKYDSYYKFTFVRNPWARILSSYFWRQRLPKKRPVAPFPDFVENAKQAVRTGQYYRQEFGDHFIPQTEYTRDVDDVFRCENFENAVRTVAAKLGVFVGRVPAKTPKHHDKYREFYDGRTRAVIAELYREEIEELGYRFEEE